MKERKKYSIIPPWKSERENNDKSAPDKSKADKTTKEQREGREDDEEPEEHQ